MVCDVTKNPDGSYRFKVDTVTVKVYKCNLSFLDGIVLRTQIEGNPMWYLALMENITNDIYWDWIPNSKICGDSEETINRIDKVLLDNRIDLVDTLNVIKAETLLD